MPSLPLRALALLLLPLLCPALVAAQGYAAKYSSVPASGIIVITDYGFREWGPELVHYSLDTKRFLPGKLELLNDEGAAVPFQIEKAAEGTSVLAFVAAVRKGGTSHYRLQPADRDRSREGSPLTHRKLGDHVEVGNEYFTLQLPNPERKLLAPPVAATAVPAPLLRWKQAGFDWVGGARFFTERTVSRYEIACIEDGPAEVTYRARYTFVPQGEYVWQVRVSPGLPVALVSEDFDFGSITEGQDFLLLGVGEGWTPEQIGFLTGENTTMHDVLEPLPAYVARKNQEKTAVVANVSSYTPPAPFLPGQDMVFLDKITATGTWGPKGGLDLRATQGQGDAARTTSLTVTPYFAGSWRRAMCLPVWNDPARGVEVGLPLSVRPLHWYLDLTDDQSPFSSHEHDPDLPASYGRRVWALGFGVSDAALQMWPEFAASLTQPDFQGKIKDPLTKARAILGYIGLDRYKEWIVDWPEDRKVATYPRAYATPEIVARIKKTLDQHPDKALLQNLYLINGQTQSAIDSANAALSAYQNPYDSNWQTFGLTSYMTTYSFTFTVRAEDALACPDLPTDLRQKLRRMTALYAYLFSEPDFNPRGAGMHLGNPNMPIGRTEALVETAPLLPDHPRYAYWMTRLKEYTAWKLAAMTEPGGAWFEPPTYQMYGPTRALALAQTIIRNSGWGDLSKEGWHAKALEYDANLTMPDVRYKGWRILPGMGNSGNTLEAVWGQAEGVMEASDKDEAGFFRYMHRLASGNERVSGGNEGTGYTFMYLPDVPEKPRTLTTKFITGYGVAFRAHFGDPDETAMLFRCGYNKSHWDMDDLNTILYGKGAPLSPGTGYQYYYGPANANDAIYHNRVKVGKLNSHEPFGRCENTIQDYGFGDNVDYAVGREYYPPEYFDDGKGEMEWRRHILFLKSASPTGANYFVMRDTFPGGQDRQTWWHWLNLDGPEMIHQQGSTLEMSTKYGAGTYFWFAGPPLPGKVVLTFDYNFGPNYHHRAFGTELGVPNADAKETKTIYQLTGRPGGDYFYLVFPHKDGEATPTAVAPAEGVMKITTAEATDYAFASDTPLNYDQDEVLFTGKAGAVRIFADRVVLAMNSGAGRVGYRGYSLEGFAPFERTVRLADLKPGVVKIEGGYEKAIISKDLGGGITVTGEGPFTASLDGENIRLHTTGRARVFTITRPPFIWEPQLFLDGKAWMAYWTDEAGSDWGKMKNSNLMAVATTEGEHDLLIRNRVFIEVWQRQFAPLAGKASQ
jgi:hypothetical protein